MAYAKPVATRHDTPWLADFPAVVDVYVGCPAPDADALGYGAATAHAHDDEQDGFYGAICFAPEYADRWDAAYPSATFLHEAAHLVAGHVAGHGPEWRAMAEALWHAYGYAFPFPEGEWQQDDMPMRPDELAAFWAELEEAA